MLDTKLISRSPTPLCFYPNALQRWRSRDSAPPSCPSCPRCIKRIQTVHEASTVYLCQLAALWTDRPVGTVARLHSARGYRVLWTQPGPSSKNRSVWTIVTSAHSCSQLQHRGGQRGPWQRGEDIFWGVCRENSIHRCVCTGAKRSETCRTKIMCATDKKASICRGVTWRLGSRNHWILRGHS